MINQSQSINYQYFWNSHSLISKGQTGLVFNHFVIQWKWKVWLQTPQAIGHSNCFCESWSDWHSIHGSWTWFLHIAHVSIWISFLIKFLFLNSFIYPKPIKPLRSIFLFRKLALLRLRFGCLFPFYIVNLKIYISVIWK